MVYLSLWQAESRGELGLPPDGDVFAVVKLLLQLQALVVCVNHAVLVFSPCLPVCEAEPGSVRLWSERQHVVFGQTTERSLLLV